MTLLDRLCHSPALPLSQTCTVAFSGGADSTALLLGLILSRETLGITSLRAVHVHHGIRGAEAERDAAFCAAFCEAHHIPFTLVRVDVPAYASAHHLSIETAARILRYDAMTQAAPEGDILLAHHAADNAETLLFHLMRGSGLKGLCGMAPRKGRYVRPLLYAEKQEILDFLQANHQDFVEDSTNAQDDSSRNRIRHGLLPLMQQENPAVISHITRTAGILSEDEAFLTDLAMQALASHRNPVTGGIHDLNQLARPIRMRIYRTLLAPFGIDPSYQNLLALDGLFLLQKGKICISGNVYGQSCHGTLYLTRNLPPLSPQLPLATGENQLFPDRICKAFTEIKGLSRNFHTNTMKNTLDFDKIYGIPYFRPWLPDDRIWQTGEQQPHRLKKRISERIPVPERQTLYALYDAEGLIWCEGIGVAARVAISDETSCFLHLQPEMKLQFHTITKE